MAVQKIEYQNKESIESLPDVAEKNKVTDSNMNEIKSVVNNNADELSNAATSIEDKLDKTAVVSSVSSSSTNEQAPGAKLFYDTVGDLESILETLDTGNGVS